MRCRHWPWLILLAGVGLPLGAGERLACAEERVEYGPVPPAIAAVIVSV